MNNEVETVEKVPTIQDFRPGTALSAKELMALNAYCSNCNKRSPIAELWQFQEGRFYCKSCRDNMFMKKCPVCGGEGQMHSCTEDAYYETRYHVECIECSLRKDGNLSSERAIRAWNERPLEAEAAYKASVAAEVESAEMESAESSKGGSNDKVYSVRRLHL